MRVVVIGIGNPIASDDGVGIRSVREFGASIDDDRVCCVECERGGLELLDLIADGDSAVIVDAAHSGSAPPGSMTETVIRRPFASTAYSSLHTLELHSVLGFGSLMGMRLPDEVKVLAVEAADIETFHEGCTPGVERAIPDIIFRLRQEILKVLPDLRTSVAAANTGTGSMCHCEILETA